MRKSKLGWVFNGIGDDVVAMGISDREAVVNHLFDGERAAEWFSVDERSGEERSG